MPRATDCRGAVVGWWMRTLTLLSSCTAALHPPPLRAQAERWLAQAPGPAGETESVENFSYVRQRTDATRAALYDCAHPRGKAAVTTGLARRRIAAAPCADPRASPCAAVRPPAPEAAGAERESRCGGLARRGAPYRRPSHRGWHRMAWPDPRAAHRRLAAVCTRRGCWPGASDPLGSGGLWGHGGPWASPRGRGAGGVRCPGLRRVPRGRTAVPRLGQTAKERGGFRSGTGVAHHGSAGDKERCSMRQAELVQADCRGTRMHPGSGRRSGGGDPHHDQRGPPGRRARVPTAVWHVAGAGETGARRSQPQNGTPPAIAARRVVRFVVSRTLKQAVAEVGSSAD